MPLNLLDRFDDLEGFDHALILEEGLGEGLDFLILPISELDALEIDVLLVFFVLSAKLVALKCPSHLFLLLFTEVFRLDRVLFKEVKLVLQSLVQLLSLFNETLVELGFLTLHELNARHYQVQLC